MNKLKTLLIASLLALGVNVAKAQCCNVVSTNGINAITANGICATTIDGLAGDCGESKPSDLDKDGILDAVDRCPKVAGIVENKGCPALSEEIKSTLLKAAHIQFKTGSDVILEESYPNLDAVVAIMKSNSAYNLDLGGHTDNTGNAALNLDLSKKRAAAAKQYLMTKGITANRMTSDGYGSSKPVATNDTAEGRKENRRVEFNIKF